MDTVNELRRAIDNEDILEIDWYTAYFSIIQKTNKYVQIRDKEKKLLSTGEIHPFDKPILTMNEVIKLPKGFIPIVDKEMTTTVGNFIVNYLFSTYALNNKLPYHNTVISVKKYHREVIELLTRDTITVKDYIRFGNATNFLNLLSPYVVWNVTEKSLLPPKNLKQFKKDLVEKYNKERGPQWIENPVDVYDFTEELKKYYMDYLKDDPAFGKFLSGKVLNESRRKRYLAIGTEKKMSEEDKNTSLITALMDDLPMDKEKIAIYFNGLRSGSYMRAVNTQGVGLIAKLMLRAAMPFVIDTEDCKTKIGIHIEVNKYNVKNLKNMYIIVNGKSKKADDIEVGKVYEFRTLATCKAHGDRYCKVCAGSLLGDRKNGISLLLTGVGGAALNGSMKSFHVNSLSIVKLNKKDLVGV